MIGSEDGTLALAVFGAGFTDFSANFARSVMVMREMHHETRGGAADLGAIHQQTNVMRGGVLAAQHQAMGNGLLTRGST